MYLRDLLSLLCNEVISSLSDVRVTFRNAPPPANSPAIMTQSCRLKVPIKSNIKHWRSLGNGGEARFARSGAKGQDASNHHGYTVVNGGFHVNDAG